MAAGDLTASTPTIAKTGAEIANGLYSKLREQRHKIYKVLIL